MSDTTQPSTANVDETATKHRFGLRPLRIWPPVLMLIGMVVFRYLPSMMPDGPAQLWMASAFGPLLCGLMIGAWWLFISRAGWKERVLGLLGLAILGAIVYALIDPSMIGPAMMMVTVPLGMAGFALGAIFLSRSLSMRRTLVALLMAAIGFGFSLLIRNDGMWGGFDLIFDWRWNQSAEAQFLADKSEGGAGLAVADAAAIGDSAESDLVSPQWSGFRGNDRSGTVRNVKYVSSWSDTPKELWRITVGPGWGSFAVAGNLLFTQEQRGDADCVVCYTADSGVEVWEHRIESRFNHSLAGPGPRATPTLAGGQLYVMGAEGFLSRIDPRSGELVWKVDVREVADVKPPMWGFSASPLVVGDTVVAYAAGAGDKGTVAFDVADGSLKWNVPAGTQSYSSPHLCKLHGQEYAVMVTNQGMDFIKPDSGEVVSKYDWEQYGYRALQPYVIDSESMILPTGKGAGTRRVKLDADLNGTEVWTTMALKPDFNDLLVFEGYIYGFDGGIFTCIDIETGERKWKGGRYGKGQALLLEQNGVILVVTEKGKLVVVEASPEKLIELATIDALPSKTWNHPVLVGERLYLRNDREAVCYELPIESSTPIGKKLF